MVAENRQSVRKVLKTKAQLILNSENFIQARTVDIGLDGIGLVLPSPVIPGQEGRVIISMYFDGKAHLVDSAVKVTYCVFSSGEFRVGFQFASLAPAGGASISAFLRLG